MTNSDLLTTMDIPSPPMKGTGIVLGMSKNRKRGGSWEECESRAWELFKTIIRETWEDN
jgi:hypothetical protein